MPILVQPTPDQSPALGDPDNWVDLYGDALMRFAVARVRDAATAEDLVQETLISAWRGRAGFDGQCNPLTWLTAILRRRIADHFRRVGRTIETSQDPVSQEASHTLPPSQASESSEFWSIITRCTGELPEHLARAFRLRTFADEDFEAICQAEGISRKNLSVRLHRARSLLRRCLQMKWFNEPPSDSSAT